MRGLTGARVFPRIGFPGRARVASGALIALLSSGGSSLAADSDAERPSTTPLTLLVQGDAVLASAPAATRDPNDPPAGAALRLRRVRVGDDVRWGTLRLRALFEAQAENAAGEPFGPVAGGRLPIGGPLRATDLYLSWAPSRAFHLDAGSMRVPFSLSRQVDEADLRMLERPGFVEALLPDFRSGVAIGGDLGELLYRAAIMAADQTLEGHLFDSGVLAAARLTAEPLGPVGLSPWRLSPGDPWYAWFRFAASLSVLYGTIAEPRTFAIDPDFQAQWRRLVVTAEYLFLVRYRQGVTIDPTSIQQGAALEPGVTLLDRRLDLVVRADWQRAAAANSWGAGAGFTAYAPDPRLRFGAGFEWRHGPPDGGDPAAGGNESSYWAIARITIVID
jgi:hypothetical protein